MSQPITGVNTPLEKFTPEEQTRVKEILEELRHLFKADSISIPTPDHTSMYTPIDYTINITHSYIDLGGI